MGVGRARRLAALVCVALVAGCSYEWDGLRPLPDEGTDASVDVRAPADVLDVIDVADVSIVSDVADVIDASDVADVRDVPDASDVRDVADVRDVIDASDVVDASAVIDVADASDASAVVDVAVDLGAPDVGPPDVPPTPCAGPAMTCACSTVNPGGYCRPGQACTAGACVATALQGSLVITEIMNDPMTVIDDLGEWVEVYNPGATPLDLRGVRIGNSRMEASAVMASSPVLIAPMSYAVLSRNGNTTTNGGVTVLYAYPVTPGVLNFGNTSTDAVILDLGASTTEIDRVTFDGATGSLWPRSSGRAKSLRPTALNATDNDLPASWCNAPARWSPTMTGDYGSPGAANPACP